LHGRRVPAHLRLITRHALLTYATKHWPNWQRQLLTGIIRLEARARSLVARGRGDVDSEATYDELGRLAVDVADNRPGAAARRLIRVVRQQEGRRASPIGRYPRT